MIITILGPTHINMSYLAGSATETTRVAGAVDVGRYKSAVVVVRTHSNKTASGTGNFTVKVYPAAPSAEDPRAFVSAVADATITIDDGTAEPAPKFYSAAISTINGAYYTIEITGTQGGSSGAALAIEISIDLVVRET